MSSEERLTWFVLSIGPAVLIAVIIIVGCLVHHRREAEACWAAGGYQIETSCHRTCVYVDGQPVGAD